MPPPTTAITLDELRTLAAEVFEVDVRAVTAPYHDPYTICLGALWSPPIGPHVEYRSIEITLRRLRDSTGSLEGTHAFQVCFDVLEGILRRRSAARAQRKDAGELEPGGPPSTVRARLAPSFPPTSSEAGPNFTEALPSEPPEPGSDGDRHE